MKNLKLSVLVLLAVVTNACVIGKKPPSEAFLQASRFHERIAILPFIVDFNEDYKQGLMQRNPKTREQGYFEKTSMYAGMQMQKYLFQDMAKQVQKGRYELAIQDFLTTNKTLEQADFPYRGLSVADKGQLAKQLGVDALLFGTSLVDVNYRGFNSGGVTTRLSLYDARTGNLLWEEEVSQQPASFRDTPEFIAGQTVGQLAKRLPYLKR